MAPPTATSTISEEQTGLHLQSGTTTTQQPETNPAQFFEDVHFLGDKDGRVKIRSPPTFTNKLDERKYKMQHLAVAFRVFAKQGFDEGVAGHISLRDPINPGSFILLLLIPILHLIPIPSSLISYFYFQISIP
jgi:hypothetical protein